VVSGRAEPFGSTESTGSRGGERQPGQEQQQHLGVQEQMFCRGTCRGDPKRDMPFFYTAGMILIHLDSISFTPEKASLHPRTPVQIQSYLRDHDLDEEIHFCEDAFKEYVGSWGLILQGQQLVWRMLFTLEYSKVWTPGRFGLPIPLHLFLFLFATLHLQLPDCQISLVTGPNQCYGYHNISCISC